MPVTRTGDFRVRLMPVSRGLAEIVIILTRIMLLNSSNKISLY